jgi:hypothetical protein
MEAKKYQSVVILALLEALQSFFTMLAEKIHFNVLNQGIQERSFRSMYPIKNLIEDVKHMLPHIHTLQELSLNDYGCGIGNVLYTLKHLFNNTSMYIDQGRTFKIKSLHGYDKHATLILQATKLLNTFEDVLDKKVDHLDLVNINFNVTDENRCRSTQHIVICNSPFKDSSLNHLVYKYLFNSYPKYTLFLFPNNGGFGTNVSGIKMISNRLLKKTKAGIVF